MRFTLPGHERRPRSGGFAVAEFILSQRYFLAMKW